MSKWQKYFKLKGIVPGKVHVSIPQNVIVDFTDIHLDLELVKQLWESDFPYLTITADGEKILYGIGLDTSASNLAKMIRHASNIDEAKALLNHKPESKIVNQAFNTYSKSI